MRRVGLPGNGPSVRGEEKKLHWSSWSQKPRKQKNRGGLLEGGGKGLVDSLETRHKIMGGKKKKKKRGNLRTSMPQSHGLWSGGRWRRTIGTGRAAGSRKWAEGKPNRGGEQSFRNSENVHRGRH